MIGRSRRAPLPPRLGAGVIPRVDDAQAPAPVHVAVKVGRTRWATARRLAAGLMIAGLACGVLTLSQGNDVAQADVCIDKPSSNTWGPEQVRGGIDSMIAQTGPNGTFEADDALPGNYASIDAAIADTDHTDYEKLGTSGTIFSVDYGSQDSDDNPCFPVSKVIGNFLANSIFNLSKVVARVAITSYQWATSPQVLAPLGEPLDELVASFNDTLIKPFLGLAFLVGAATVLLMALRRRFANFVGAIGWMIAATVLLILFVIKPSALAGTIDGAVSKASSLAATAGSQAIENKDPHVQAAYSAIRAKDPEHASNRIAADMMWRTMIFQPWAAGQWGRGDGGQILMTTDPSTPPDTPSGWYDGTRDARWQQVYSQACVLDPNVGTCDGVNTEPNAANIDDTTGQKYAQSWYMIQNWTCSSAAWCLGPDGGGSEGGAQNNDRKVNSSNGWSYRSVWSGDSPDQRLIGGALTGSFVSLSLGGMIFVLSAAVILFDLVMYVLLIFAPFFLLLGIQPTWGRKLVEGMANTLAQNALKRVMVGIALSVLIALFSVIQRTSWSWGLQVGLMLATAAAILLLRKPLMSSLGVVKIGHGGETLGGVDDAISERAGSAGKRGARRGAEIGSTVAGAGLSAPGSARRRITGARVGAAAAREHARQSLESGTPLTRSQAARSKIAAMRTGASQAAGERGKYAAEHAAERGANRTLAMRGAGYERGADRKFSRTEQGRAKAVADHARAVDLGSQARAEQLAARDEDVRVAATVAPKRFGNTAQNLDGYDFLDGSPVYTNRNRRRRAGGSGRHAKQRDQAAFRGTDEMPARPEGTHASLPPKRGQQDVINARRKVPLRAAMPWRGVADRRDQARAERPTGARKGMTWQDMEKVRDRRLRGQRQQEVTRL